MNKAEKERLARRQRMLAREQGQAPEAGIRGTSGDISLRTPKPVRRAAPPPGIGAGALPLPTRPPGCTAVGWCFQTARRAAPALNCSCRLPERRAHA